MQVRELLRDDDAVSPVIGVILMVAITVILAAVIASFVLGLGGQQTQNPQASFSWDYEQLGDDDGHGSAYGVTTITHDGGDSIPASELYVRGSGFADDDGETVYSNSDTPDPDFDDSDNDGESWSVAGGDANSDSEVTSGNSLSVGTTSEFDLRLVWEPAEGDTSATLSQETGPDA